ncbi:hypothetical protein BDW59DRAFT_12479 [Aspergillus cavernicola]|uniref:Uncharacterized protein n=1 Tax=Aspergillus cavernicola TaxID=176166 RepID=A0ABR4HK42_9EURO
MNLDGLKQLERFELWLPGGNHGRDGRVPLDFSLSTRLVPLPSYSLAGFDDPTFHRDVMSQRIRPSLPLRTLDLLHVSQRLPISGGFRVYMSTLDRREWTRNGHPDRCSGILLATLAQFLFQMQMMQRAKGRKSVLIRRKELFSVTATDIGVSRPSHGKSTA